MVKKIVTTDRVAEDLDVELEQLFPNNRESRRDAVRIILKLSESGPLEQSKLAQDLELAEYTLSRLLSKMELHGYVIRTPRGPQKIVTLT
jgi:DNA-binding MarR family transcriptional regulator